MEHHETGIPWTLILTQLFNLTLVVILLVKVLRKPVRQYFQQRKEKFHEHFVRAEKFMAEAREKNHDIKERLRSLTATSQEQLDRAHGEAAELKARLQMEAQTLSRRLESDAQQTVVFERERAIEHLREDLLADSIAQAEKTMKTSVKSDDQKRLQGEFFQKIQVIQ